MADLKSDSTIRKQSSFKRALAQVIATTAFGCLILSVSSICTLSTVVLGGNYKVNNSDIYFTDQQASWFGSVVFIVQPVGSISSGFIQDTFGRRKCMMGVTVPQFAGWIIIYFAQSVETLFFAVVMMGLSIGFMEAPAMSFLGEVTQPQYRGVLATFSEIFLLLGITFEYFVGAVFPWRYACLVSAAVPIIAFISIYIVPESPVWLLVKGRHEEAEAALCWLRGWVHPDLVREEFSALVQSLGLAPSPDYLPLKPIISSGKELREVSTFAQVKHLKEGRVFNPVLLVATFFFVGHCTSLLGLRPFLVSIFNQMNMPLSSYFILVTTGVLLLCGSVTLSATIKCLGKRKITLFSLSCCTACCFLLALYFFLKANVPWIPFALFGILFFFSGYGVMPLPWVLCCEVFPLDARGIAAGLAAASSYIFSALITKTYLDLEHWLSLPGTLVLYGAIGVFGVIFLYFRMPETEGKTLDEVELYFNKKKALSSPD